MEEFLWRLTGADYLIIRNCSKEVQKIFGFTGVFVLLILFLCLISSFYAFDIIFDSIFCAMLFAGFWTFMIGNLYGLNLITINNNSLPQKKNIASPFFALAIRFCLIALIGIFISKPIELCFFGTVEQNHLLDAIKNLNPASWIITSIIVMIFFVPIIIKLRTSAQSSYGMRREEIEKELVISEYKAFKKIYSELFFNSTGEKNKFEEIYIDPPYNTEKVKRKIIEKGKLLDRLKSETKGKKI